MLTRHHLIWQKVSETTQGLRFDALSFLVGHERKPIELDKGET
jgi:hypothetical protein